MKSPSFKSLASMLLAGALSAPVVGCGMEGLTEDDETTSATGALTRAGAVSDVDAVAAGSKTTARQLPTTIDVTTVNDAVVNDTSGAAGAGGGGGGTTGTTDLERNYPWSVRITETGGLDCRGTLIHPLWVLTAGHCIGPYAGKVKYSRTDPATGVVTSGEQDFNINGPQRGIFRHPGYELDTGFGQPKDDIALIRLKAPFAIDRNIQTAALPRFWANPGRIGTIATNNHSNAPAGYTSIVRAPQLSDAECTSPSGFICISPPAGSLCGGDSGSGFVEILDGRATLVGITSNIAGGDHCIAANKQAQLSDVFHYRDWIYATMGMSPEQVDGRVRLRWSGVASQPGVMSLQCLSAPLPDIEVSMNVPGSEIAMNCDDARVFCQAEGWNLNMGGFTQRTFASNGSLIATQALPFLPNFTAAFADPGSSFLRYDCSVYNLMNPSVNVNGSLAKAAF